MLTVNVNRLKQLTELRLKYLQQFWPVWGNLWLEVPVDCASYPVDKLLALVSLKIYVLFSWSSGLMKSDVDRSFQMMTCPAETANLISWLLVSASASSFRNDCAGNLNYASKCLTDRYQHLIVNCCVFSNQISNNIKSAILLQTYHMKTMPILKSSSLIGSSYRHGILTVQSHLNTRCQHKRSARI